MKKLMTTFVAAVLMTSSAQAQVQPRVLGENHAMVSLETNCKYVLLPVEEKADIASIRVIGKDNHTNRKPNVRLAVDHADYYVPLEIKDGQTLDIMFHGDRRTKGPIKDFSCWKEIKYSNTFDTTNRERFRPVYHHTPVYGWMNDPNGMFYKNGEWHLYYQYNPYGSLWENMTWGHSVSKDLVHWEALPNAIEPDAIGTIFSGSCVVDTRNSAGYGKDAIIAYYTSAGEAQAQSMAYSTDGGRTFTKYEKNPVITNNIPDFRDPNIFWHEPTQKWIMMVSAGQEMQIYSSPNLKDWTLESSFGRKYGNHDGVWECPDMMQLPVRGTGQQKWMLVKNITKVSLELGGKAPAIVCKDADLERAAQWIVDSRIGNNGQICNNAERVYVQKEAKEAFTKILVEKMKAVKVGDPCKDDTVDMGPLVEARALESVTEKVNRAIKQGAKLLCGGERVGTTGYFYAATVLDNCTQDMDIIHEETFGPVIPLVEFETLDQVIAWANDCEYGLASSIFTKDLNVAVKACRELEFGETYINREHFEAIQGFHAGVKKSGIGGADGKHGVEEYLVTHVTYLDTYEDM